jgi:hypothetical protein
MSKFAYFKDIEAGSKFTWCTFLYVKTQSFNLDYGAIRNAVHMEDGTLEFFENNEIVEITD